MKKKRIPLIVIGVVAAVLLVLLSAAGIYYFSGKWKLQQRINRVEDGERYKENLLNILVLGVDREEPMGGYDERGQIGQADAVFVVSLDLKTKELNVLSVPRDSMVEGMIPDIVEGGYNYAKMQLCLQYAFGDGREESCEMMQQQVAKLLGIPIHGYVAINFSVLPVLNDAIGGVDITMDQDYTFIDPSFVEGATLHLNGQQVRDYLQGRDTTQEATAYYRLDRHKQYIQAAYQQVKTSGIQNPLEIKKLMDSISDYVVTDLAFNEILQLVRMGMKSDFDMDHIRVVEGEIVQGEAFEEYYIDEEKKETLVQELFYR